MDERKLHGNAANLAGIRFGRLTAISPAKSRIRGRLGWTCHCDCGNVAIVTARELSYGDTKSCGCLRTEKAFVHGMCGTPEYQSWDSMIQRCANPRNKKYRLYGARGIEVCARWLTFKAFFADMGPRPPGMTIDRIDNNGGYEPTNCRWATYKEQNRNHSANRILTHGGVSLTVSEWTEKVGLGRNTINGRLLRGWTLDRAITAPKKLNQYR